ncbi:MAG: Caa(3)-type oxidase subunit IV [Polyangiaceae bacterium]|nr:Caa(3)-type oxidase subunit IV [Polyangiaceae bacterium]
MEKSAHSGRPYLFGWIALIVLTALSFGLSRLHLGGAATPVALGIAGAKVAVVGLVFMHLARARAALQLVALTSVVFIALLVLGVAGDVSFR